MKEKVILLASVVALLISCNHAKKESKYLDLASANLKEKTTLKLQVDDSYTLMKNNCYACHNPNSASHDEIIAPPFRAVKMHYTREHDNKEDFVNAVVNWVQNPTEDKALMFGAIKRFKVMPKMELEKKDLEKIAIYLYDNPVEEPEWMDGHMKGMGKGKNKGEN